AVINLRFGRRRLRRMLRPPASTSAMLVPFSAKLLVAPAIEFSTATLKVLTTAAIVLLLALRLSRWRRFGSAIGLYPGLATLAVLSWRRRFSLLLLCGCTRLSLH